MTNVQYSPIVFVAIVFFFLHIHGSRRYTTSYRLGKIVPFVQFRVLDNRSRLPRIELVD
jgi:hypothetical protein